MKNIIPYITPPASVGEDPIRIEESLLSQTLEILDTWGEAKSIVKGIEITDKKKKLGLTMAQGCTSQITNNSNSFAQFHESFMLAYSLEIFSDCKVIHKKGKQRIDVFVWTGYEWEWVKWSEEKFPLSEFRRLDKEREAEVEKAKEVLEHKKKILNEIKLVLRAEQKTKKTLLQKCCPALLKISDDTYEGAKLAAPIILSLTLTGAIYLPIQPIAIAGVALLISRMVIAGVCADYEKKSPEQSKSKK